MQFIELKIMRRREVEISLALFSIVGERRVVLIVGIGMIDNFGMRSSMIDLCLLEIRAKSIWLIVASPFHMGHELEVVMSSTLASATRLMDGGAVYGKYAA